MKTSSSTFKNTALAAAVAGGVLVAGLAAQAQQIITFNPGTVTAVNTNIYGSPVVLGDLLAAPGLNGTGILHDQLNLIAGNVSGSNAGADPAGGTWGININADRTFTETFRFNVLTGQLNGIINRTYGVNTAISGLNTVPEFDSTYVSIVAQLSGTISVAGHAALATASNNIEVADAMELTYDNFGSAAAIAAGGTGTFEFFFHPEGDITGTATSIAVFGLTYGAGDTVISDDRFELAFKTEATSIAGNPSFLDENGDVFNPLTNLLQTFTQAVAVSDIDKTLDIGGNPTGVYNVSVISNQAAAIAGLSVFPAVPEPSALAVFGIGLIGLGLVARRRKSKSIAA